MHNTTKHTVGLEKEYNWGNHVINISDDLNYFNIFTIETLRMYEMFLLID